jgi:hypothetical protein
VILYRDRPGEEATKRSPDTLLDTHSSCDVR